MFRAGPQRRVVLATNVAESSLTVPGIRFVIDTGTARISRYSPRSKVQRLPIEPISQASADQRKGRCGRLGPGICIRLFSEEDYLSRDRYTTPEIRRTNLAAVILQMLALKLGSLDEFPFLDPPRADAIRDGYKTLYELGAIDRNRQLTEVGRQLSRLPADPRIGRMILAGQSERCLNEVLIIAAALEVQDPRERPAEKEELADQRHALFAHEESDFLSYLKLWDGFRDWRDDVSRSRLRKICQENFLSFNRMREWQDVHRQLLQLSGRAVSRSSARRDEYDAIHRALLAGLLSNIALRRDEVRVPGDGWREVLPLARLGRLSQASRLGRGRRAGGNTAPLPADRGAQVSSSWIEPLADHLVKRTYSDPYWSSKSGTVLASERVSLFGLTLVAAPPGTLRADRPRYLAPLVHHACARARRFRQPRLVLRTQPAIGGKPASAWEPGRAKPTTWCRTACSTNSTATVCRWTSTTPSR